jgi:hypothetical protein
VRVTWQTSHIGRNITVRSANDELSRLRSIRKLPWTTACHRIISTGQPLRFQEASNILTDVIFMGDNGTCLHRRSSSELCQGQMSYFVTQSAQIHHRLQRHIYTTPPLEKPTCNEKAYIKRKYIPTDSPAVPACVFAYTGRCTMLSYVIDSRCFGYLENVSRRTYECHVLCIEDLLADREQTLMCRSPRNFQGK